MNEKRRVLKEYFGHDEFRDFQEEAVDAPLQGRDLLTVLPTGGGKSLCYQLPTLLMDGLTVVISPLIALMQDQVAALQANGIAAQMISSSQKSEEIREIYYKIANSQLKLLYVAPERLHPNFLSLLSTVKLNFFVIDEAHCLSEWGHDFRSDYRRLDILKQTFANTPVAAFTATATAKVQDDIIRTLHLRDPRRIKAKAYRPNLHIHVQQRQSGGRSQILSFLKQFANERGIIYTYTRKESENLADFLAKKGYNALAYHAGMEQRKRQSVHEAFIYDTVDIVVATIAFGMGIDKANIRYVIHTSMPKTLEGYYQEIGRAGRDGAPSYALLLYQKSDEVQKRRLVLQNGDERTHAHGLQKLQAMASFCCTSRCRHEFVAEYFGDNIAACEHVCDNCQRGEVKQVEVTVTAQKIISAIHRTGQRFGATHILDVLKGSKAKRIFEFGHDGLSVYAIAADTTKANLQAVLDLLMEKQMVAPGPHGSLMLTRQSLPLLRSQESVFIDEDKLVAQKQPKITQNSSEFEALRALRKELADKEGVPAYVIFGDKTLLEMSTFLPTDKEMMLLINGVGKVKYEKYGQAFVQLCQELAS
ncbi:MAG: DNA helicase RecQ [Campylobacterota bacterium]